jgi:hypothetical protein
MRVEDLILVSIDDHVIEPRDMFEGHVPEKYKAEAPKSIMDENGFEKWWFQGVASQSGSLNAVVGWPNEEWGMNPTTFAEMRPGSYDIHERVRDRTATASRPRCVFRPSPASRRGSSRRPRIPSWP